ncbi:hypothetical protein HOT45_gp41 [Gordonia phage Trine]|uniref:Uncharacterized protein n=1 Tax=Gordonia phage Trine TaxID=2201431 RepID=A0A2Z4Q8Z0_9CAUD|nr:hypothetical protein HOT45_gp41 [Gordonia phage Trine]AWY06542.1 hypothetical protein PBI_TRINE_41 [Gordonia phage Trine]
MDLKLNITGTAPLLMHNARLSDEFDPIVRLMKEITAKRTNKTDDDRWELRRLEFHGGLYLDKDLGPFIPGQNIERALRDAAVVTRQGKNIQRGVVVLTSRARLDYDGPRTAEELWEDKNFVSSASIKVGTSRVIRTRPMFQDWAVSVDLSLDTEIMDRETLEVIVHRAGKSVGLGDWRPRYGTFTAELTEA